jgi:hypothetical protein
LDAVSLQYLRRPSGQSLTREKENLFFQDIDAFVLNMAVSRGSHGYVGWILGAVESTETVCARRGKDRAVSPPAKNTPQRHMIATAI